MSSVSLDRQLKKEFRKMEYGAKKAISTEIRGVMAQYAGPVLNKLKDNTPIIKSGENVIRRERGRIVATYEPGNLRKSMRIFQGTGTTYPRIYLGPAEGSNLADDGYYAYFLIHGTSGPYGSIKPNNFPKRTEQQMRTYIQSVIGKQIVTTTETEISKQLKQ
jgi:hypothetical protein